MQAYWVIRGYKGTEKIYDKKIKNGVVTLENMKEVLKSFVVKEGALTLDETLGAYAKIGSHIRNELLHVHHDQINRTLMCGNDIYFTAQIVNE